MFQWHPFLTVGRSQEQQQLGIRLSWGRGCKPHLAHGLAGVILHLEIDPLGRAFQFGTHRNLVLLTRKWLQFNVEKSIAAWFLHWVSLYAQYLKYQPGRRAVSLSSF